METRWIIDAIMEHLAMVRVLLNKLVAHGLLSEDRGMDAGQKLNHVLLLILQGKGGSRDEVRDGN